MSSWISHLPPEVEYRRVIGLGMNEVELRRNERLDSYVVQNLNTDPRLPFGSGEFDGAGICVSIDYLTRPVEVLREVGRVLKVGAPVSSRSPTAAFPRRRSRSGTASTTPATCASSRATSRRPETSATSTASTAVRAAFFPTRFTPWSEGARDRSPALESPGSRS